jgi:dCMP deaminase
VNRISRDEMLMEMAIIVSLRGTCNRAQVGAVISREGRVISMGYNGAPAGLRHCDHPADWEPSGGPFGTCPQAVHAEANCIAWAARRGDRVEGAEIHTTHQPCLSCAMLIVNAGIVRVTFRTPYRLAEGKFLLESAGVRVERLILPTGS